MTVLIWRIGIESNIFAADDLSGEGARLTGGRWNRVGTPLIYSSSSIALACLETIVHLNGGDLPLNRYLVSLEVPHNLWKAAIVLKPEKYIGWDAIPAGITSIDAGNKWAATKKSALLLVPSVIIPEERNILINPAHPDAIKIRTKKLRRWTYDARLLS